MAAVITPIGSSWLASNERASTSTEFVPLSLGVGLGLHWVVYSWIVKHPVGLIHAVLRSILIVAAWYLFPNSSILAISCVIVLTYLISIYQMLTRNMIRT